MKKNIRKFRNRTGVGLAEKSAKEQKKKLKEVEDYLKTIPPPPLEHTAELEMEKELKRIIREEEKEIKLDRLKRKGCLVFTSSCLIFVFSLVSFSVSFFDTIPCLFQLS